MKNILISLAVGVLLAVAVNLLAAAVNQAAAWGPYEADLVRVTDGDTLELRVWKWPGDPQLVALRVYGANTPEKAPRIPKGMSKEQWAPLKACEKAAGSKATEFTRAFVEGKRLVVTALYPSDTKFYGRISGSLTADGEDLGAALLASGHARPYGGGHRGPWCDE